MVIASVTEQSKTDVGGLWQVRRNETWKKDSQLPFLLPGKLSK